MLRFDFLQKIFFRGHTEKVENEEYDSPKEKKLVHTSSKKNITSLEETEIKITPTICDLHNTGNLKESNLVALDEIKSEVNLMKLPFFALSRQNSKKQIVIRYKDTITRGDERIDFSWEVSGNVLFGHPGIFDKKVFKAVEQIINQNGWSDEEPIQNPIKFSLYQICKIIGKSSRSGKNLSAIRDALKRIQRTSINCQGAFYVKNKNQSLYDDSFYLYNRVVFRGEKLPDDSVAETNYLYLGDPYLESLNAFYVKKIDYKYYQDLKSSIARRLYEILDIKFYGLKKHSVKIEYKKLCALLPVAQQKYYSNAKWKLKPAHDELMAIDPKGNPLPDKKKYLQAVRWTRPSKNVWEVEYFPTKETAQKVKSEPIEVKPEPAKLNAGIQKSPAQEKPKEPEKKKQAPPPKAEVDKTLIAELAKRGISKSRIQPTLNAYKKNWPDSDLLEVLECFDFKNKKGEFTTAKNKPGLLIGMIQANDNETQGYTSRTQRTKATEKAQQQKLAREKQEREKQGYIVYKKDLFAEFKSSLKPAELKKLRTQFEPGFFETHPFLENKIKEDQTDSLAYQTREAGFNEWLVKQKKIKILTFEEWKNTQ